MSSGYGFKFLGNSLLSCQSNYVIQLNELIPIKMSFENTSSAIWKILFLRVQLGTRKGYIASMVHI